MGIEVLYGRRIGVQPRSWADLSSPSVPTAPGSDVADAGPRAGMTLRRNRDTEFLIPTLEGLPRGSSWCSDELQLAYRINQGVAWNAFLDASPPSTLRSVEMELARKMVLQRGAASGWDVFHTGLGLPGGGSIDEAARAVGQYLLTTFGVTEPQWTTVPRGTNSGAPTYGTSDLDKLFHALLARTITDFQSADDAYTGVRRKFEAISDIHAIAFSRTGPTAKEIAMYDWAGDTFAHVANAVSVVPRRRAVFGVPAFINMALLGYANIVKYCVMRTPWTAHPNELAILEGLEFDRAACGPASLTFSDDISGFDQSVRFVHQQAIARHIYGLFWPAPVVDLWLGAQRMPVLAGPLHFGARGYLYTRPHGGVTTSGIITTSLDGTLINLCRAITAVAAVQRTSPTAAFQALVDRRWGIKAWGDDTVMTVPGSFDLERYGEANAAIGYQTSPQPGATFLMKHYDLSRRAVYPLATRVLQQTFWNERGGRSEAIELLGLFARTTGFSANPFWREAWALLLERSPVTTRFGITTRDDLGRVIGDPGFVKQLHADIKENRSLVAAWLARAERGHSEDQQVLSWLDAIVGHEPEEAAKLDLSGVRSLSNTSAARMLAQLADYLSTPVDDRGAAPSWIDSILNADTNERDDNANESQTST